MAHLVFCLPVILSQVLQRLFALALNCRLYIPVARRDAALERAWSHVQSISIRSELKY